MVEKKRDTTTLLVLGAAGLAGLYLWSRPAQTLAAVQPTADPRLLAQAELLRRLQAGDPKAGTNTLSMLMKLGGAATTFGGTLYKIFSKVLGSGNGSSALKAVSTYVTNGPQGVTAGLDSTTADGLSVEQIEALWPAQPTDPSALVMATSGEIVPLPSTTTAPVTATVPTASLTPTTPETVVPTTTPTTGPSPVVAEVSPASTVDIPAGIISPEALDGQTAAVLAKADGSATFSLTKDQVDATRWLVDAYDSKTLDLSLLTPDQATTLDANMPTLRHFAQTGDWSGGQFSSPVSGDTIVNAANSAAPPGGFSSITDLLNTPLFEGEPVLATSGELVSAPATTIGDAVQIVGQVGSIVAAAAGMAFTIMGHLPDWQKAVYCAMDAAAMVVALIPVWGWVAAAAIELVKFIFGNLFGGGETHAEREAKETQRTLAAAGVLGHAITTVYTVRELWDLIAEWNSGYVGGTNPQGVAVVSKYFLPDGSARWIGFHDYAGGPEGAVYTVGTPEEWVHPDILPTTSMLIQAGVKPEYLTQANAALVQNVTSLVPIMLNAKAGDFDATHFLVTRYLTNALPPNPLGEYAPDVLALVGTPKEAVAEYPMWWDEIIEQTAYTLQAVVWGYPTWVAMMSAALGTDLTTLGGIDILKMAVAHGYKDFGTFRAAFFNDPTAYMGVHMDKVYDLQKQIELLANSQIPIMGPSYGLNPQAINSLADLQALLTAIRNFQAAQALQAQSVAAMPVP